MAEEPVGGKTMLEVAVQLSNSDLDAVSWWEALHRVPGPRGGIIETQAVDDSASGSQSWS
jgi:hypothetical protein